MPGIDGFELRKLIREVDKERPIIFLTAMIDDGNMTMLNQITWDSNTYYLNKVFDKKVLVQKITEVVNMHRTRQLDRVYRDNLESELKLAGDLQRILLPDWCILDDKVLVSSLYVPAMQVSGDIFELIRLDESRYLFLSATSPDTAFPPHSIWRRFRRFSKSRRMSRISLSTDCLPT